MKVLVGVDENAVARAAAALIAERRPRVLGVATGSSPVLTYRQLVRARSLPGDVQLCLLDEYVGLAPKDLRRYRSVIVAQLADPLGLPDNHVHAPDVDADDLDLAADRYEHLLCDLGGVDVQLLGIGRNGHIGFNE
ncbi:MAG: 6-phosphogluconolactonase, partial [Ilumatobacteraceae bacterium]|nr:6-phosphogluconolactonase [Ilumatobacteraceae bacterium]